MDDQLHALLFCPGTRNSLGYPYPTVESLLHEANILEEYFVTPVSMAICKVYQERFSNHLKQYWSLSDGQRKFTWIRPSLKISDQTLASADVTYLTADGTLVSAGFSQPEVELKDNSNRITQGQEQTNPYFWSIPLFFMALGYFPANLAHRVLCHLHDGDFQDPDSPKRILSAISLLKKQCFILKSIWSCRNTQRHSLHPDDSDITTSPPDPIPPPDPPPTDEITPFIHLFDIPAPIAN